MFPLHSPLLAFGLILLVLAVIQTLTRRAWIVRARQIVDQLGWRWFVERGPSWWGTITVIILVLFYAGAAACLAVGLLWGL